MKILLNLVILTVFLLNYDSAHASKAASSDTTHYISLTELVATPSKFAGKRVSFIGYVVTKDGSTNIFLSMNHARFNDLPTAFQVQLDDADDLTCDEEFVRVDGRFSTDDKGTHLVEDVTRIWTIRNNQARVSCLNSTEQIERKSGNRGRTELLGLRKYLVRPLTFFSKRRRSCAPDFAFDRRLTG